MATLFLYDENDIEEQDGGDDDGDNGGDDDDNGGDDDDDGGDDDDDGDDIRHEQVMTIAGKYFALYRSRGLSEGKRKESLFIPRHPTMAL